MDSEPRPRARMESGVFEIEDPETELRHALVSELPSLRAHALRLCRNPVQADDLVHDSVERALRFSRTYEPGTNPRAWLHQILFSVFITSRRRGARERHALLQLETDPCAWTRPDQPAHSPHLGKRVDSAIEALPPPYRSVLRLVDLEERSYRDAASALGVPVGTVMSRLFRGRRLLAACLGDGSSKAA
jgi:RNA polymerase sigma-70 factor, ECF subfamily